MSGSQPLSRPTKRLIFAILSGLSMLEPSAARASDCSNGSGFSACFDANGLWLPAGRATFMSIPDTQPSSAGQIGFGIASELLHQPLLLRVASPDRDGRDVHLLDYAMDVSYFLSFGLPRNFEVSVLASTRAYQTGAGVGGIRSQSAPPLERSAVRDPRMGLAYSLDDALAAPGFGLRLAVDATLPIGDRNAFANERSLVVMPNATLAFRHGAFRFNSEFGVRLRERVDFGGVSLSNQGFVALGAAVDLLQSGWLSLSAEAFGLPPLSSNRGSAASPQVSETLLFPAEWLAAVHSSFGSAGTWTVSLAAGSGLPLSSETRDSPAGARTSYFMGLTAPDFRSLLVLRFVPAPPSRR